MHGYGGSAGRDGELGKVVRNMHHDGSNNGRGLPDAPMVSALTRSRGYHRAWPLLVVAAVYASLAVDAVAQGGVATDRAALVALYDATGGENWRNSTNWKTDAPLGEWYGVTTGAGRRVTRLSLGTNALTGPIPERLGRLSYLTWLDLGPNALTGPIPNALGSLSNLLLLNLGGNELTGPIPEWLGGLSYLTWLSLENNDLTGPIPERLGRLSSLTHLYLYDNELSGPIPEVLGGLSNLEWLNLRNNDLTGPIPDALGQQRVDRADSRRPGAPVQSRSAVSRHERIDRADSRCPGRLSNLEVLYLYDNDLTGPIPEVLGSLSNLTKPVSRLRTC